MQPTTPRPWSFLSKVFVVGMVLIVLSAVFYKRAYIGGHVFLVPLVFCIPVFISMFFLFSVKRFQDNVTIAVKGWKKFVVSVLMFIVVVAITYEGLYVPLNSRLVTEIGINQTTQEVHLTLNSNTKYYIQADLGYVLMNAAINISFANRTWKNEFQLPISRSSTGRNSLSTTTQEADIPFLLPETGEYTVTVTSDQQFSQVKRIRIFEVSK